MFHDLVQRCRSYRRFRADRAIPDAILRELIDLARLAPSAANKQPLRFLPSHTADRNARIFPHLRWAGYLTGWEGPDAGERPAAYVVILGDREVTEHVRWDDGIAAYAILLGAVERGLGGCMIASLDRPALREALHIPARYEIQLVIALGEPLEEVVVEPLPQDGDIRYWRDERRVHHVPKRGLDQVIVEFD